MTIACPVPITDTQRVQLGHGSGGKMSAALLRERFMPAFANEHLASLGDAAVLDMGLAHIAMSTDTFVVSPLEFPGGDIGSLAVHGTVNDLAMMAARPRYLTAGFVLEEGLPFATLDRIVASMGKAATACGVQIVAGDTKVVERGKADGLFINTAGIGECHGGPAPRPDGARAGDVIIVSGPIGRHGIAIMSAREGIGFESPVESDSAPLWPLVEAMLRVMEPGTLHAMRDPTRGGVASALNEIAAASRVGVVLDEPALPIPEAVAGACEMLGLDPLYVANEGVLVAFVDPAAASAALWALHTQPLGRSARMIGTVVADHPGLVALETELGGSRIVDMLPGDQLPRIC